MSTLQSRQTSQELIFICLKFGTTYQSIQIDRSNPNVLNDIHQAAVDIVSKAIGSLDSNSYRHHIKLFLISPDHQPPSLKLITRSSDLTPTCFIEIVIWRSDHETLASPRDHILLDHNYKKPTYCSACDYFMWGLIKQGKRCKVCKRDFHHQCAEHLPADCPGVDSRSNSLVRRVSSTSTTASSIVPGQVYTDGDISLNYPGTTKKSSRIGKIFNSSSAKSSNSTSSTSLLSAGRSSITPSTPNSSAYSSTTPNSSKGSLTNSVRSQAPSTGSLAVNATGQTTQTAATPRRQRQQPAETVTGPTSRGSTSQTNLKMDRRKDIKLTNCQEKDGVWTATGQFGRESRHSKRADIIYDKKKFKFTQKDEQGNKHVYEIPAAEVEAYRSQSPNSNGSYPGDNISGSPPAQAVIYHKLASFLLDTINEAAQTSRSCPPRSSFKMVRGTENDTKDFADLYDMNEKEILGMGRFGMVFGGTMRRNGVRVAIKKIQISQCTQKDRENIEQEATYLFQLNHPGILKFEGIFDFEQHIFLVTERLDTDMLNFILSNTNPKSRLNEDMTRFLAFQLVAAIRYLHFKNIAHCDLKPDNVLINIFSDDVVHLKVGDFGYARTIHEHSLRYTKVGTTAYLPPEVSHDQWRHQRGYNKTVDMWAIGVIIFVSLTGYFPFHEELDILPQLDNIPKLFQDEIFAHVTEDVKDLLKCRLLVPDAGHRMHSAGVIYHDWFQKSQKLLHSCRQLEECLEKKWLTLFFEENETPPNTGFNNDDGSDSN